MPRDLPSLLYVGIKNSVVALDIATGMELWRTKLKGHDFVNVLFDGVSLVASNAGELFGLDPTTGAVLWHNTMKGMGLGIVSLASSRVPSGTSAGASGATLARQQAAMDAAAAAGG
ncbi:MAG TPA: PQQ-binding-like beta-propeller repeat protein [Gemmatimonadaceae bacterium]|jgi:outer membrane protein assembly factor BamB|nr:PQQ-binding-like beta-propeller repeat protein [Gemmatimonadaceae bacterium]